MMPEFTQLPFDVMYYRTMIANVVLLGEPGSSDWVLVDAGVRGFADRIRGIAKGRFSSEQPKAIVLTHGHFDHIGSLEHLLEHWNVPVYAHESELPYLQGKADYPPGDPSVGGGLMAEIAPLYPHQGIDLGDRIRALNSDGSVPYLPEWRWVHTPGHTEGHVSLFRNRDKTLIAGDAFITVKQESALAVITQRKEIHGPPTYFTTDWDQARSTVQRLHMLQPEAAITGHGVPMFGEELADGLEKLASHFDEMAIPDHGKYVHS
ncbi:MBL fold metallo-hydrolase [Marinicrinis lubricantis]|uniref:MBL fold metallo-hydrolase n=1 Tax=Marinicrinis lubricantis TaxID=2086470 RepID=A0ABW1IK54_9BACL